jgi:hypothetical protein
MRHQTIDPAATADGAPEAAAKIKTNDLVRRFTVCDHITRREQLAKTAAAPRSARPRTSSAAHATTIGFLPRVLRCRMPA